MKGDASPIVRLSDIIEAIDHLRDVTAGLDLNAFQRDWEKRWLVERGLEIVSEASRRLSDELKARHLEIPWRRVAGIGNVLRHEYERVEPALLWKVVQDDLQPLRDVCQNELERLQPKNS